MFDLVPLAGPRWQVTHGDRDPQRVRQRLETHLPQPTPRTVAASAVCEYEQRIRAGVTRLAFFLPPQTDALDGEVWGVVADAYIHEPTVVAYVVDPIRDGLADTHRGKVMDLHADRLSLRLPGAPRILEVAHQLLLLGVH